MGDSGLWVELGAGGLVLSVGLILGALAYRRSGRLGNRDEVLTVIWRALTVKYQGTAVVSIILIALGLTVIVATSSRFYGAPASTVHHQPPPDTEASPTGATGTASGSAAGSTATATPGSTLSASQSAAAVVSPPRATSPQTTGPVPSHAPPGPTPPTAAPSQSQPAPAVLTLTVAENPFRCDGPSRVFGQLSGALPGETLTYSSSPPYVLTNGAADANGNHPLIWQCDPGTSGPVTLTARGLSSGRSGSVMFQMVSPPPLVLTVAENPFRCDGPSRVFGQLSGALPGETLTYSSSPPYVLTNGAADANGNHPLIWQCDPGTSGPVTLTARGLSSGRSGSVTFQMVSPS